VLLKTPYYGRSGPLASSGSAMFPGFTTSNG
jgi:hypothetical protein